MSRSPFLNCVSNRIKLNKKMNELPANVLLKILDSLPTKDAIRCRLVCRAWHELIEQFVLDELNIFLSIRQHTEYFDFRKCFSNLNKSLSFPVHLFSKLVSENEQFYRLFRNVKKFFFKQHCSYTCREQNLEKLASKHLRDPIHDLIQQMLITECL